ncbi:MAG: ABC transporter ATP-binding protein [bacterium]|nr:ABC transporter ATP-binding protein [bacterium]
MLKLNSVSAFYGHRQVLREISLQIAEGEIVTLIGSNGAGKSTTLNTICGVVDKRTGLIEFQGKEITRLPTIKIVKLGICQVPEGRRLFPDMTVLENLELGAYLNQDKQQIKTDLERVFHFFPILRERRKQMAGTLSGGEQQMLAIGRGLMAGPKLLLLDEPSLGLAPKLVQQIFAILEEINKEGVTIFLVEQNAHIALKLANRGYVLETGRIVLSGQAEWLLNNDRVKKAYLGE